MEGIPIEIKRRRRRRPHKSKNKLSVEELKMEGGKELLVSIEQGQVSDDEYYYTVSVDPKTNEVSIKSQTGTTTATPTTSEDADDLSHHHHHHHHHHHYHGMFINGCGCTEPVPGSENCCAGSSESSRPPKRRNRCRSKRRNSSCRILEEKIAQHEELIENLMKSQSTSSFPQFVVRERCPMVVSSTNVVKHEEKNGKEKTANDLPSSEPSTELKKGNKLKSEEKISNFYKSLKNCNKEAVKITSISEIQAGDIIYFKQVVLKKSGPKPSGLKKAKVFLKMKKGEAGEPNSLLFRTFRKFNHGMPADWKGNLNDVDDLGEPFLVEFSEIMEIFKEVPLEHNNP